MIQVQEWVMNGIQHQLHYSVTLNHVSAALKLAAGTLEYPTIKCIPIERVNITLFEVAALTPWLLLDIWTLKSKKWVAGAGPRSKNMSGMS